MRRFSSKAFALALLSALVSLVLNHVLLAGETHSSGNSSHLVKSAVRMNCGAQIECVTPDGKSGKVSRLTAPKPNATALIMEDDTVTCLLQEGETNFVIELPKPAMLDRLTFLNENAAARGELRISVSNQRLPANSPEWTAVEGAVQFAHKRVFGVSLVGIETKFVRLSFRVEQQARLSALATYREKESTGTGEKMSPAPLVSGRDEALDSTLGALNRPPSALLSSAPSVGPLSP